MKKEAAPFFNKLLDYLKVLEKEGGLEAIVKALGTKTVSVEFIVELLQSLRAV